MAPVLRLAVATALLAAAVTPAALAAQARPAAAAKAATAPAGTPEIQRAVGTPQAIGAAHTLRQIPEACVRFEGKFTGTPAAPYDFQVLRPNPSCQPRARFVDYAAADPSAATGWLLNDVIRVPSAACPAQQAVVTVWRKPGTVGTPELDGQGRARLYLDDAQPGASKPKATVATQYAAKLELEGAACN